MFRNYFTTIVRSLFARKLYSSINVLGLAIGMTACLLISLYVWKERGYDQFHENKERIFRVRHDRYTNGQLTRQWVAGPAGIGPDLKNTFPEVKRYVRLMKEICTFSSGNGVNKEDRVFYASEDFFKIFSFSLVRGSKEVVLSKPFTMVISESMARRYFGDADPIGKTLRNNGKNDYEITGVFKDVPENSHIKFDALMSFDSFVKIIGPVEAKDFEAWEWDGYYTYIELGDAADQSPLQAKIPDFVESRMGAKLREWNEGMAFVLQPLTTIHLNSNFVDEIEPNGSERTINQLSVIAYFILFMAWMNYVNLATAKSLDRAKEVGLRQVLGAKRGQVVIQFLFESFVLNLLAAVLTLILTGLLLPGFSAFVQRQFDLLALGSFTFWVNSLAVFIVGSFSAGIYPAFVLSGFPPISIIGGKFRSSSTGAFVRKSLVVVQFATSVVLISGALVIYKQIKFLRNSPLGFEMDQVLVLNGPSAIDSTYIGRFKSFKEQLLEIPGVVQITATSAVPGRAGMGRGGIRLDNQNDNSGQAYRMIISDENYREVFGIELLAGRYFSRDFNETNSMVVNETAIRMMGINEPEKAIGLKVNTGETIVGVLKDYHHESVKKPVDQLIYVFDPAWSEFFALKLTQNSDVTQTISNVGSLFRSTFPGNVFSYFFLDDFFNRQYYADQQFAKLVGFFTAVGIIISCMGLFGLSSFVISLRTREIGIRKILGSSVSQIFILVSREYVILVIIANVVAFPLSYYLINDWLSGFANRIGIGPVSFLLPAVLTFCIALLTVSFRSIKAASANPINSLRD